MRHARRVTDDRAGLRDRRYQVRPFREQSSILEREIEQGCEHEGRELDRYRVDPVKGLALRQRVEYGDGPFPNQFVEVPEAARGGNATNGLALIGLLGRVHRNEGVEGHGAFGQRCADRDAEGDAFR